VPQRRLPVVLSAPEVAAVLAELDGGHGPLARLLDVLRRGWTPLP